MLPTEGNRRSPLCSIAFAFGSVADHPRMELETYAQSNIFYFVLLGQ
jgi:hypothetical protein